MKLFAIQESELAWAWPLALPFLEKVFKRDSCRDTKEAVYEGLKSKYNTLWFICDGKDLVGICTTTIFDYPSGRRLVIGHCAGDGMDGWLHLIDTLIDFAKTHNCIGVEIIGRRGWIRALANKGAKEISAIIGFDI